MRNFRSIIVIGMFSIGLVVPAFGIGELTNDKKAGENKEKISCTKNTSYLEYKGQSFEKKASFENCKNNADKSASGKAEQMENYCSKN